MKKRIICLFCTMVLLVTFFSGCKKNKPPDGSELRLTDILLADNKASNYKIVVPTDSGDCEKYAAVELKKYFFEATEVSLSIENDADKNHSEANYYLALGNGVIKTQAGLTVTKEEVNLDGFKIKRYGKTVIIAGFMERGTLYGVYEFLSKCFNYECYAVDEIAIDKVDTAFLPDFDLLDKPSFEGRYLDGALESNMELQAKLRMKDRFLDPKYGNGAEDEWIGGHCESFFHIIPPDKYIIDHPEWFSTVTGGQLCFTKSDLVDEIVKNLKQMILDKPQGLYVNIAEEDMGAFCSCGGIGGCRESKEKYGVSGSLIRFCNNIIKKLEEWRKATIPDRDLKYVTFIYRNATMEAPVTESGGKYIAKDPSVIPHEKLYVRYTPILSCYSHNFYDSSCDMNKSYAIAYDGWRAITDRFMVWDYNVNYDHYFLFFNNYGTLKDNYVKYYENGAVNMMRQDSTGSSLNSLSDLDIYIHAKLQWNVYADVDVLINNFMKHYYKTGDKFMKEYFQSTRYHLASVEKIFNAQDREFHFGIYDYNSPYLTGAEVWPKARLEQSLALFQRAYAEYDKMEDVQLAEKLKLRVLKEDVCVRYLVLKNYSSYYNIYSPDYEKAIDVWENDIRTLGAYSYAESRSTFNFIESLRDKVK